MKKERRKNLLNKNFGKLTVIESAGVQSYDKRSIALWKCKCECGNIIIARSSHLNIIRSCGCIQSEKMYKGYEDLSGTYWNILKKNAKTRNIEFIININDAWDKFLKQNKTCALTGVSLTLVKWYRRFSFQQTASLDRIDSSKGYVKDNIQWIHKDLQSMKMDLDEKTFINWCSLIVKYKGLN